MRHSLPFLVLMLALAAPCHADDWKSLGRPLDNDSKAPRDRYVYFDDNTVDKNIPLDKAVMINTDVQDWIAQRIAEVMKLDGPHYDQQVAINRLHFTAKGYGEYVNSLNAAQLPDLLKNQHYTLSAVVLNSPNISAQGLRDVGTDPTIKNYVYIWQAEVPITLNYQNLDGNNNYTVYLDIELERIPMQADSENTLVAINGWKLVAKPTSTYPAKS